MIQNISKTGVQYECMYKTCTPSITFKEPVLQRLDFPLILFGFNFKNVLISVTILKWKPRLRNLFFYRLFRHCLFSFVSESPYKLVVYINTFPRLNSYSGTRGKMILPMLALKLLEVTYGFLESSFVDHSPSDVASKVLLKLKEKHKRYWFSWPTSSPSCLKDDSTS